MSDEIKISTERPPIYLSICQAFKINPIHAIFTYGDTLYNPNKLKLTDDLIAHEKVHMEQQGHNDKDAALWWGKFLRDPAFRVDQEARAYGRQYDVMCEKFHDRNMRCRIRIDLAGTLSGPLYQHAIDGAGALNLIKQFSKTKW